MSGSSKQLTLFDCTYLKSAKRAKLSVKELSPGVQSSNKVCEDYSGNEEGMPSTTSPCCTPVVIYNSSDDAISSDKSVQAGFSTDDDNSHLLIPADRAPFQPKLSRSISSTVAVAGSTVIPSSLVSNIASTGTAVKASDLLCTNATSLEPISYRCIPSSGSCNGLPKDIAQSPCFPPVVPNKTRYLSTMFSNVSRCFKSCMV